MSKDSTKHTPGPWRAVIAHEGTPAASVEDIIVEADEKTHVVCFGHDYDDYGAIYNIADAYLIAAAPDLLAACTAVFEEWSDLLDDVDPPLTAKLRAAIVKAGGAQ